MADLQTTDYKGKDRRNGNKLRLGFGDYLKMITIIATVSVAGITGWVTLKSNVQALAEDVKESKECTEKLELDNEKQDKDIVEIKSNVENIKEDVIEIKADQKENKILLYKILSKMNGD